MTSKFEKYFFDARIEILEDYACGVTCKAGDVFKAFKQTKQISRGGAHTFQYISYQRLNATKRAGEPWFFYDGLRNKHWKLL